MTRTRRAAPLAPLAPPAPWIGLIAAVACAACSSNDPARPLQPTYTATIRVEAVGTHPEPAVWNLPESVDVTIRVVDSTAVPPEAIAAGDIFVALGTESVRLPLLADRTTYRGRARAPAAGEVLRLRASGARGLVDSFTVALTVPDVPIITEPLPDSSIFPAKEAMVRWGTMQTYDAVEVVLRSVDFPETDSVVSRPSLDDGFLRIAPEDVARIPPGFATIRVTRTRGGTFTAPGLRAGTTTAASSMSEQVYVLAPESPRRVGPGRRDPVRVR